METGTVLGDVRCGSVERPCHYRFHHASVPDRERLLLVRRGGITVYSGNQAVHAQRGEFVSLAAGVETVTEYTGEENCVLMFWFTRLRGEAESSMRVYPRNPAAAALAESAFDGSEETSYRLAGILYGVLHELTLGEHSSRRAGDVRAVIRYIEHHYKEEMRVCEYAQMAYMSESHFRKLFCEATGMGPVAYRNTLRLRAAGELIGEGYTVSEAASAVGFRSLSFYCRLAAQKRKRGGTETDADRE